MLGDNSFEDTMARKSAHQKDMSRCAESLARPPPGLQLYDEECCCKATPRRETVRCVDAKQTEVSNMFGNKETRRIRRGIISEGETKGTRGAHYVAGKIGSLGNIFDLTVITNAC